ncbi:hypothetical protein ACC672_37225 [Rhizobium ruizarguesonis]
MLTGPVTILNCSFFRDDLARAYDPDRRGSPSPAFPSATAHNATIRPS